MSMTWADIGYEEWAKEQYEADEALKHEQELLDAETEGIERFKIETLQSYFKAKPDCASSAKDLLTIARNLAVNGFFDAALVFAWASIEQTIKNLLVRPIIYGLIHDVAVAETIASMSVRQSLDSLRGVLRIISHHMGINFSDYKRAGSSVSLWQEVAEVKTQREHVVHKGILGIQAKQAQLAIDVASELLERLFPSVLKNIGLSTNN